MSAGDYAHRPGYPYRRSGVLLTGKEAFDLASLLLVIRRLMLSVKHLYDV